MLKKLTLTATFSMLAIGCGSNVSKTKDYWKLNEPVIHAWDTSEDSNFRGFNQKASEFDPSKIKGALEYSSYIQFTNLTSENEFFINTTCTSSVSSEKFSKFYNSVKIPMSQKLYFYNYLPEQVAFDNEYVNSAPDYKCNYEIKAKNKINSEHVFSVNDLTINTFKTNILKINSKNSSSPNVSRSIIANNRSTLPAMPSLYYSSNDTDFELENELSGTQLVMPGEIRCIGNNKFELKTIDNIIYQKVNSHFADLLSKTSTSFLKKCRVFAQVRFPSEDSVTGSSYANEIRTVWSEYFNVIFDEPKIKVQVTKIDLDDTNNYPLNTGNYIDGPVKMFDVSFTNTTDKKLRIYLPSEQKIKALISPLIYNAQRHNFDNKLDWNGLRALEIPQEFETELRFMSNNSRVLDLTLEPGQSKNIYLEIDKNFVCNFNVHHEFHQISKVSPTAERGFRIKALDINSDQNLIKIEFENQGKLEAFPDLFSFNQILETANKDIKSIDFKKSRTRNLLTNILQLNLQQRATAIDSVFFRKADDLVSIYETHPVTSNALPTRTLFHQKNHIQNLRKHNYLPDYILPHQPDKESCQQIY